MVLSKIKDKVKKLLNEDIKLPKPLLSDNQLSSIHSKFEYLHFTKGNVGLTIDQLNEIGDNGWELVSHTAVAGDSSVAQYYVFKRVKK